MRRVEDWPRRLAAFVERARHRPFQWGVNDCALLAAAWVLEAAGEDFAAPFRGRYEDKAVAVALLAARGGLEAVVTAALGAPLAVPALARRGDVVMVETAEGRALGVCVGAVAACAGAAGLAFVEMGQWRQAWRV